MPTLPVLPPPSCLQVGLRLISGSTEKLLFTSVARRFPSVPSVPSAPAVHRPLSTKPCRRPIPNIRKLSTFSRSTVQYPNTPKLLPRTQIRTVFGFRAIVHYAQLPNDYEDAKGIPFSKADLNQKEINEIFGSHLTPEAGNELLRIIQGRRVAGSLDDPDLQQNTAKYSVEDKIKALNYLRENIPVDEVINAGLRAEDELKALEEQGAQEQDTEQHSEEPSSTAIGRLPGRRKNDSPYGEGEFDRIRAKNIAKREAEEKRLEEERKQREEEEAKNNIGTLQTEQKKPREMSPWVKKYADRATSTLPAPPEMKAWERLLPALAMTILVCGIGAVFATYYKPPRNSWRLWPDIPPAAATCIGLVGLNIVVWMAWKIPPLWALLNRYFLLVAATPRPAQLVGAVFSHHKFGHMTANMVALAFFGTRLHDEIGRGNFLALYVGTGAVGFLASLTNLVLRGGLEWTTLGASGAIYGLCGAYFWLHRYSEFKIFGYPPDPMSGPQGLAFIGLIIGCHIIGMFGKRVNRGVDVASHLGGMFAGIAGVDLIKRRMDDQARARAERMKTMGMLDKAATQKKEHPQT